MKKLLFCFVAIVAVSGIAAANSVCVSTVMVVTTTPGLSFTCGNLTFSNFYLSNLAGANTGTLDINQVTVDNNGVVTLNENPNLGVAGHLDLYFQISGGVNLITLAVGGTGATVTERACANPIPTSGPVANLCTNAAQTTNESPLGQLTVHSLDANQPVMQGFVATNPIYVFKDIGADANGGLSTLNEGFGFGGGTATPEPVTFVLLGSALGLLGLMGRRRFHRE